MDWKEKICHLLQEERRKERRVDTARRKHIDAYMKQRRLDAKIADRVTRGGAPRSVQQTYSGPDERKKDRRVPYATRVKNRPKMSRSTELSKIDSILSDYSGQKKS
jgi:hypothetical protein